MAKTACLERCTWYCQTAYLAQREPIQGQLRTARSYTLLMAPGILMWIST